jgi:dynein heavy chain, axonemal
MFDSILDKQIEIQGGVPMIKFGDQLKDYSYQFKFYICTKLSRPHYPPEVCVKVQMLNFMVTEEGLED